MYPAFRGQLFHTLLEANSEEGAIVEKRFKRTLACGVVFQGKPDVIYKQFKTLEDWKTSNHVPYGKGKFKDGFPNHIEQINSYRYLLAKPDPPDEPIEIDILKLTYLDMGQEKPIFPPVWSMEKTGAMIEKNAEILQAAFTDGIIPDVHPEYPHYKLCDYCPDEIRNRCSEIWELNHRK
jgi:hypothetical protein